MRLRIGLCEFLYQQAGGARRRSFRDPIYSLENLQREFFRCFSGKPSSLRRLFGRFPCFLQRCINKCPLTFSHIDLCVNG